MTTADALKQGRDLLKIYSEMKLQYITIPIELFESLMFGIETYMAQAGSLAEGYAKILAQKEAAIKAGGSCWLSVSHEAKCSAVKELRK